MVFLRALGAGVLAGLVVFLVGILFTVSGAPAWLVSLGAILKGVSGLVAVIVFIYSLFTGWPWNSPRVA